METYKPRTGQKRPGCFAGAAWVIIFLVSGYCIFFYPLIAYDRTVVDWRIPVIAGSVVGLLAAIAFARTAGIFLGYFFIAAFALNAVFFFLNDTFSDGKMKGFKLAINTKHPRHRKYGPNAGVVFFNKKLYINAASDEGLKSSSYAIITADKGLFGYYIVRGERLFGE